MPTHPVNQKKSCFPWDNIPRYLFIDATPPHQRTLLPNWNAYRACSISIKTREGDYTTQAETVSLCLAQRRDRFGVLSPIISTEPRLSGTPLCEGEHKHTGLTHDLLLHLKTSAFSRLVHGFSLRSDIPPEGKLICDLQCVHAKAPHAAPLFLRLLLHWHRSTVNN